MTENTDELVNVGTIAKALRLTPRRVRQLTEDGILRKAGRGRYDLADNIEAYHAWRDRTKRPAPADGYDSFLEDFTERLVDWREIYSGGEPESHKIPIEKVEDWWGCSRETMLTTLRMGAPYTVHGDIETGEGFCVHFSHYIEWTALMIRTASRAGPRYRWIVDLLHP